MAPKTAPVKAAAAPAKADAAKAAPADKKAKKTVAIPASFFVPRPKNFGVGQSLAYKRDLTRFVKWPRYIRIQRQRRVLYQRLKVPPTINQFTITADKNLAFQLFKFSDKYRPETAAEKKIRLVKKAAEVEKGKAFAPGTKPSFVKFGLKHVTTLVEQKKASLVLRLPALCRKQGIPYAIVKGKARLGKIVGQKTATAVAFVGSDVRADDRAEFATLVKAVQERFNDKFSQIRKTWGGQQLSLRSRQNQIKRQKALTK